MVDLVAGTAEVEMEAVAMVVVTVVVRAAVERAEETGVVKAAQVVHQVLVRAKVVAVRVAPPERQVEMARRRRWHRR